MKNHKHLFITIIVASIATASVWLLLLNQSTQSANTVLQKKTIKIGGILPLSGDAASGGIPLQQAAEVAVKEINNAGGLRGKLIETIWEDGHCEKTSAKIAAEKLLNQNDIDFLIGGACSDEFLVSAPLAQQKNILSFTPSATSPQISLLGENIFRTTPSDSLAGKAAAQYGYTKLKSRRVALISEDKDFTTNLKEEFRKEYLKLGGAVVYEIVFKTGTNEFDTIANAVKAAKPDLIYLVPQTESPGVLAIKSIKQTLPTTNIMTGEILLQRQTVTEQGTILEGITGIELYYDETNPKTKHLLDTYKSEYGVAAPYPAYMTGMYDIFYLIKEAYVKTDGSTEKMAEYLHQLNNWPGAVGELSFDKNGDPVLNYSIRKVKNKQTELIEIYRPQ